MKKNKKVTFIFALFSILLLLTVSTLDMFVGFLVPAEFLMVSNITLTTLVTIAAIVFALFFIYVQVYVNRYPAQLLGNLFGFSMKTCVIAIGTLIAYGLSLILFPNRYFGHIFFWTTSCLVIICFFAFALNSVRQLSINTCVNDFVTNIKKDLSVKPDEKKFREILNNLYSIYEECITKEEYFICQIISESTQETFKDLLKEHNRLIIDKSLSEDNAVKLSTILMKHSFKQISCIKNINSPKFVFIVISTPIEYISTCISIGQYTLYKKSIDELAKYIYYSLNNDSKNVAELLYDQIDTLIDELTIENDRQEWMLYLLQKFHEMTHMCVYVKKDYGVELFAGLMQHTFYKCIDTKDEDFFNKIFDIFLEYTIRITRAQQNLDDIRVYYISISRLFIEAQITNRINRFDSLLDSIESYVIGNRNWVEFFFYYISELKNSMPLEYEQKMREKNISVLSAIISLDENPAGPIQILLPDYESDVKKNKMDSQKIKTFSDELRSLCRKAVVKDNADIYYIFLDVLNQSVLCLPKEAKDSQMELFSVYYYVLDMVSNINNQLFPKMTVYMLRLCIEELDKNKCISQDFGATIIKKLQEIASRGSYISDFLADEIIELFRIWFCDEEFLLGFLMRNSDTKQLFYKALYSIGISCIEYGKEESLRKVSNAMGWSLIHSIKRKESGENVNCLLELIIALYKISVDLEISKQTLTFLMTLFTTVGTYCELDVKYCIYQKSIIKFLSKYELETIQVAAKIRTSENTSWDDLFEGKTEIYTKKFLNKVKTEIEG